MIRANEPDPSELPPNSSAPPEPAAFKITVTDLCGGQIIIGPTDDGEPEIDSTELANEVLRLERTVKAAQDVIREQRKIIAKAREAIEAKRRAAGWDVP